MIKVEVYRNLHKKCWSVRYNGRVIAHVDKITIEDAEFVVQKSGRKKVLRDKQKTVHAFVKGMWNEKRNIKPRKKNLWNKISYNPYFKDYFYKIKNKSKIDKSDKVFLDIKDGVFAR